MTIAALLFSCHRQTINSSSLSCEGVFPSPKRKGENMDLNFLNKMKIRKSLFSPLITVKPFQNLFEVGVFLHENTYFVIVNSEGNRLNIFSVDKNFFDIAEVEKF